MGGKHIKVQHKLSTGHHPRSIAISRDGSMIAAVFSNQIRVWTTVEGEEYFSAKGNFGRTLSWSSDGEYLAVASGELVQIWRVSFNEVWKNGHQYSLPENYMHKGLDNGSDMDEYDKAVDEAERGVIQIEWDRDDKFIAVAQARSDVFNQYTGGFVKVWEVVNRREYWTILGTNRVTAMGWLRKQSELITIGDWNDGPMGASGHTLAAWKMKETKAIWQKKTDYMIANALSTDASLFLSVNEDAVTVFEIDTMKELGKLRVGEDVKTAALSETQGLVILGLYNGSVQVWDYIANTKLFEINLDETYAMCFVWSELGGTVAGLFDNGDIYVWRVSSAVPYIPSSRKVQPMNLVQIGEFVVNLDKVTMFRTFESHIEIVYSESHSEYLYGKDAKTFLLWLKVIAKSIDGINSLQQRQEESETENKGVRSNQDDLGDEDIPF